jgi:hypothetical protein
MALAALVLSAPQGGRAASLVLGDILVADAQSNGGAVIRVDRLTGDQELVVGELGDVRGIAVTGAGTIYVATATDILVVDPVAEDATSLGVDSLSDLQGIAVDLSGFVYVLDQGGDGPSVLRIDPGDGSITPLLSGNAYLGTPTDLVLNSAGVVYVTDTTGGVLTSPASVITIDGITVSQLTFLDNLSEPLGITLDSSGNPLVANQLPASVVGVDEFGIQSLVSSSGLLRDTVAIVYSAFGTFVADRGDGTDSHPPSILQILLGGGQQDVSHGDLLTETGLVDLDIFPIPEPAVGLLLGLGLVVLTSVVARGDRRHDGGSPRGPT